MRIRIVWGQQSEGGKPHDDNEDKSGERAAAKQSKTNNKTKYN